MAPMAMAIPPRLMMLAVIPMRYIGIKERMIVIGMVMIGTRADGICQRKIMITNADDDEFFDQRALEGLDRPFDQIATIIGGHDLNARRKGRLQLLQFCTDPLNDLQGVFSKSHDDDAADDLSFAVQIGNPASHVRTQGDDAEIFHQNRSAGA